MITATLHAGLRNAVAGSILLAAVLPASAQQQPVKVGIGYGFAFLPFYICNDLDLIEKHAKAAGLNVKVSYPRHSSSAAIQDALLSGAIDLGPFGISGLLLAREKTKGTPQEIIAVSGVTTLPMTLLTSRADVKSLGDLKPKDRIAMPMLTAPQMYVLRMQSEKAFGQADRLREQVVALPHADSVEALASGNGNVAAYFSSPPFTQIALKEAKVRQIASSSDIPGKASFLVVGATRRIIDAHPKWPEIVAKAMDEAADIVRKEPRRAALIYLKFEPSKTLDVRAVEAILKELKDDFGSGVHGVQAFADFMGRHGRLKTPPKSWKDVVVPSLAAQPGS